MTIPVLVFSVYITRNNEPIAVISDLIQIVLYKADILIIWLSNEISIVVEFIIVFMLTCQCTILRWTNLVAPPCAFFLVFFYNRYGE